MNSRQMAQDRRLKCGHLYEYHNTLYLVVMTNNDKSRGLEVLEFSNEGKPKLGSDAYFFNENAVLKQKPVTIPVDAANLADGDFIVVDGVLYEFYYADEDGVMFKDYPSGACPILFQTPIESVVEKLAGWIEFVIEEIEKIQEIQESTEQTVVA